MKFVFVPPVLLMKVNFCVTATSVCSSNAWTTLASFCVRFQPQARSYTNSILDRLTTEISWQFQFQVKRRGNNTEKVEKLCCRAARSYAFMKRFFFAELLMLINKKF